MLRHRITQLLFLLLFCNVICGQTYRINWYTDSEGLPQNSIKDIFPDKHDFIWLSTENGLVRYDGESFKLFNDTNIKGLSSNRMKFFEGDLEADSLFSVNNAGDMILINRRRASMTTDRTRNFQPLFRAYRNYWNTPPQSLPLEKDNLARYVLSDKSFYAVGNDSIKKYTKDGVLDWSVSYIYEDTAQFFSHENRLYTLSSKGAINLLEQGTFVPLTLDLGLLSGARIFRNNVTDMVFLYTDGRLYLLSFLNRDITSQLILQDFEFERENIYSIHYDQHNEILYLGSLTQGLCIIKKKYFKSISTDTKTKDKVEYGLSKLNDSTVLTATGLLIENHEPIAQYETITEHSLRYVAQLDKSKNFWVSNGHALYKFKAKTDYDQYDQINFDEKIRSALLQANKLWIGTGPEKNKNGQGELFLIDLEQSKLSPTSLVQTPQMITALAKANDSVLFMGTQQGLYRYHIDQNRLSPIAGLEHSYIRSMYLDQNDLWITTYQDGFFLYRDAKTHTFPLDNNRYLATAHCIMEDDNGYFWITTNKGLFQVFKNDLLDHINDKDNPIYYHYYDKSAGFSNNEFNGGGCPCGVQMGNKDVLFPSLDGLVVFNAAKIRSVLSTSGIYLDEVNVDGVQQYTDGNLTLDAPERVTFQITSPFYGNPYNNQLEAKMDDGPWERLNPSKTLSFTGLAPGKHTLTARKLTGFGANYQYVTTDFDITPTFWQSKLWNVLMILLLLILTYLIIVVRTRYITKKNIQLEKKVHEHTLQLQQTVSILGKAKGELRKQVAQQKKLVAAISHDVKTPLRFMAYTSKVSLENFEHLSTKTLRESTEALFTSSHQLYQFIENVLDYSSISLDNNKLDKTDFVVSRLVQNKIRFFETISESRKLDVLNRIPDHVQLRVNHHLFSIIIHNLLDNAIKNTYDGQIIFWCEADQEKLILHIEDTGSGMTMETLAALNAQKESIVNGMAGHQNRQKGFGLRIVMELLTILDGEMTVTSQLWIGTRISISIKTSD